MMKEISLRAFIIVIALIIFCSCNKEEPIPSYLSISAFKFNPLPLQGTSNQKFQTVYVYVDDQEAGVYPLPAKIPLLYWGNHKVTLYAGITQNGIGSNPRIIYPFTKDYTENVFLEAGKIIEMKPQISYMDNLKVAYLEDFESAFSTLEKWPSSNVDSFYRTNDSQKILEPGFCAEIKVPNGSIFDFASKQLMDLPRNTAKVMIEINYKTAIPLVIGIKSYEPTIITETAIVTLYANSEWNKVYIDCTQDVSTKPIGTKHKFFIGALNSSGADKYIYVDNIKVLHLE